MIMSLEAIGFSTSALLSQNCLRDDAGRRAVRDLHTGQLTEHELIWLLQRIEASNASASVLSNE